MEPYILGFIYGCVAIGIAWIVKEVCVYIYYLRQDLAEYQKEEVASEKKN